MVVVGVVRSRHSCEREFAHFDKRIASMMRFSVQLCCSGSCCETIGGFWAATAPVRPVDDVPGGDSYGEACVCRLPSAWPARDTSCCGHDQGPQDRALGRSMPATLRKHDCGCCGAVVVTVMSSAECPCVDAGGVSACSSLSHCTIFLIDLSPYFGCHEMVGEWPSRGKGLAAAAKLFYQSAGEVRELDRLPTVHRRQAGSRPRVCHRSHVSVRDDAHLLSSLITRLDVSLMSCIFGLVSSVSTLLHAVTPYHQHSISNMVSFRLAFVFVSCLSHFSGPMVHGYFKRTYVLFLAFHTHAVRPRALRSYNASLGARFKNTRLRLVVFMDNGASGSIRTANGSTKRDFSQFRPRAVAECRIADVVDAAERKVELPLFSEEDAGVQLKSRVRLHVIDDSVC